jgi:hypothetical protein
MKGARVIRPLEQPPTRSEPDTGASHTCPECGQVLQGAGPGRHRIFFTVGEEQSDQPGPSHAGAACGYGLHGKNWR